jgi:hypothetical protein
MVLVRPDSRNSESNSMVINPFCRTGSSLTRIAAHVIAKRQIPRLKANWNRMMFFWGREIVNGNQIMKERAEKRSDKPERKNQL